MSNVLLRVEGVSKSFASTKALVGVNIELERGVVLGLIGENGSGKSTLSSIIAGMQKADEGQMFLNDTPYNPHTISDAIKQGVSIVVQEQGTLNGITVAANIFAGTENVFSRFGILDVKEMNEKAKQLLDGIGVTHINTKDIVDGLPFEDRKLLEIARAEYNQPQILLIDETTTALGKEGRSVMYSMISRMRDEGKSVIFISHDIDELVQVCDKVTVLRDGHVVGNLAGEDIQPDAMKKLMVGRDIPQDMYRTDYSAENKDEVVLSAEHINHFLLKGISLQLHRGEILGIGGLTDCGMHELGKVLFGLTCPDVGSVTLANGQRITSARTAIRNRIGYVSKNRDTEALMNAGSIKDNMCLPMLPRLKKLGLINPNKETRLVELWREKLSIKMRSPKQYCMQLSGGNKQKVSIAKWLASDTEILIFDCPTRGIDIGVKNDIYRLLEELRNNGKSILMISEELPELIGMSDKILIMKEGRINGSFERSGLLTESELLEYMI